MGRQKSINKISGTVDGLSYYNSEYGWIVRKKGGASKEKVYSSPTMQKTRENASEFGEASRNGKLIRYAFTPIIQHMACKQLPARMMKEVVRIQKADAINARGSRKILPENLHRLEGFEFNDKCKVDAGLEMNQLDVTLSNDARSITIATPPSHLLTVSGNLKSKANRVKFISGAACIDFEHGIYNLSVSESDIHPLEKDSQYHIDQRHSFNEESMNGPVIVTFGMLFYIAEYSRLDQLPYGGLKILKVLMPSGLLE